MAHLILFVQSLTSAAFRKDLRRVKDEKEKKADELKKIAAQVPHMIMFIVRFSPFQQADPGSNVLLNVFLNKLFIEFREQKGRKDDKNLRFELHGLQINRVLEAAKLGETFTRIMLSQLHMKYVCNAAVLRV